MLHINAFLTTLKYHVFENIMENGANALFSIVFSKVFKTLRIFSWTFFMLSKIRKWFQDLEIPYEVNG